MTTEERRTYQCAWRQANKDKIKSYMVKWHLANPGRMKVYTAKYRQANRESTRARSAKWYLNNLERRKASSEKWYLANRERAHATSNKWRRTNRERVRARSSELDKEKREWLNQIKLSAGCVDCGFNTRHEPLQFDHVRGVKRFTIGQSVDSRKETLLAEIAKCEVRCANCHAIKTAERRKLAA